MFSDLKSLISTATSIISAIVACVAIILTLRQIKLSNKQHLFDKRIENYIIARGLIQLYRDNASVINNEKDGVMLSNDFDFKLLTNNTYLESITYAIDKPLKGLGHKELLIKLENLKEVAIKIKFLFSGNASNLLGDFVLYYQELLFEIYRYQIIINQIYKENQIHEEEIEEAAKKVGEKTYRVKLQDAFDNLKQADSALKNENVEEQIKKQIKLL